MKLNKNNLESLATRVNRPKYDQAELACGILHIGVGAFHRAHQAYYTDRLMNQGEAKEWAICGVGLRPEDKTVKAALKSQDYLYSIYELSEAAEPGVTVVGAIADYVLAEEDLEALLDRMASPETRIVSLTITEGGYCTDDSTGEFLSHLPAIQHDIQNPSTPTSVFGVIAEALRRRKERDVAAFTVMSCDNLPHNGMVAKKALLAFVQLQDPELVAWIEAQVSFPNAMVDRITPVTSPAHRQQLLDDVGIDDQWPIVCEPFIQWVVEDKFCNGRPAWEKVGVQFTDDVTPYEKMKISLLNGSHLAMTYLGTLLGYEFAHQTMEDALLQRYVRQFMDVDVTPLLDEAPGIDFDDYKDTLIERFSNPVICDQLTRICSDGSSKFPKFVFPTLLGLIANDKDLDRTTLIVAAWCHYLKGKDEKGNAYTLLDPRLDALQSIVNKEGDVSAEFLGFSDVFGHEIPKSEKFVASFRKMLTSLEEKGVRATIESVLA